MLEKKRYWTLRCGRELIQFANQDLLTAFMMQPFSQDSWFNGRFRPMFAFQCVRLPETDMVRSAKEFSS